MTSRMASEASEDCQHEKLCLELSPHAIDAGFKRSTAVQRKAATTTKRSTAEETILSTTFPAPLVLPGDDLSINPKSPPQSFRSWVRLKERKLTPERNILYLTAPPEICRGAGFIQSWCGPRSKYRPKIMPCAEDIAGYLEAFYSMKVKLLPAKTLSFGRWNSSKSNNPEFIGLNTPEECVRVRTRKPQDDVFPRQINLNDILDVAISMLPNDAYALMMLVEHDLYEDEDDDFCCGRAYGGSRVAVVSAARYNPMLDKEQGVEQDHAWPASHCEAYIERLCDSSCSQDQDETRTPSAMKAAIEAHNLVMSPWGSIISIKNCWLGRVCRTASHELGHCFGMGHCVYYACVMQGTASVVEDVRQPLFLCPVDLAKLQEANGVGTLQHYRKLLEYCNKHDDIQIFSSFAAWIRCQMPHGSTSHCPLIVE